MTARLWKIIVFARYRNQYGEEYCRLERTSRIYEDNRKRPRILRHVSLIMFRIPDNVHKDWDEQLVDGMLIAYVWSVFVEGQVKEWKRTMR